MDVGRPRLFPDHQVLIHMLERRVSTFRYDFDSGFISGIGTHDQGTIR